MSIAGWIIVAIVVVASTRGGGTTLSPDTSTVPFSIVVPPDERAAQ